ncbi:hypothetical protein FALCPG4_003074 [Fusarium falciforme]
MAVSELVFWQVGFAIALGIVGALLLVCSCLLGGRHYKEEAEKNLEKFALVLQHQAELWKQERERREKEYELRLEEQRHKNAAFQQNSEIREDMDDVMEENRVLREQKDEISHRNEQLMQVSARLRMENAGLAVRIAQAERLGQEAEPGFGLESGPDSGSEPERPRNFSSTMFGSGLHPGSTFSLEEAVQNGPDSPVSHASFPSSSEPGTPPHTELPQSPPDNGQDPRKSNPTSSMVTTGGLLSGPKQRNTWAAHSGSSGPAHGEDEKWKPVTPGQRRTSVG